MLCSLFPSGLLSFSITSLTKKTLLNWYNWILFITQWPCKIYCQYFFYNFFPASVNLEGKNFIVALKMNSLCRFRTVHEIKMKLNSRDVIRLLRLYFGSHHKMLHVMVSSCKNFLNSIIIFIKKIFAMRFTAKRRSCMRFKHKDFQFMQFKVNICSPSVQSTC